MTPSQELKLIVRRLNAAGKGIILFHDAKARTAAMLPAFLRYLGDHHFRVVHLVSSSAAVDLNGGCPSAGTKCGTRTLSHHSWRRLY